GNRHQRSAPVPGGTRVVALSTQHTGAFEPKPGSGRQGADLSSGPPADAVGVWQVAGCPGAADKLFNYRRILRSEAEPDPSEGGSGHDSADVYGVEGGHDRVWRIHRVPGAERVVGAAGASRRLGECDQGAYPTLKQRSEHVFQRLTLRKSWYG